MAETELYMQCEEEEFVDWSKEDKQQHLAQNGHVGVSPVPAAFAAQSPASENIKPTDLPVTAAPVVPKQLMSNVLQPAQFATGGTPGQPVNISPQVSPVAPQNITTPLGFVLPSASRQSFALLSPAQRGQIITSQLASPSGTPAPAEKYTTVQIPVNLTICGPAGVQNITALASVHVTCPASHSPGTVVPPSAEPTSSVSAKQPILMAPASGPTPTAPVPAFKAPAPVASRTVSAAATRTVPSATSTRAIATATSTLSNPSTANTQDTSQVPSHKRRVLAPKAKKRRSAPGTATVEEQEPPVITRVFQGASRPPKTCSVCGVPYKTVPSLRGYLCLCNQTLVNSIQAFSVQLRKKRVRRVPHRSPTGPSASGRHPSTSPQPPSSALLKNVTISDIPEGAPSPGSGDYDQHGKLIIFVEDFFYGKDPGQPVLIENNQVPVMMKCTLCDKKLKNNIKLMNHMKHHMEIERQNSDEDCHTECLHCYRHFSSPFTLQCHVETVHSQVECTALCKICELSFENETAFLNHMKQMHKPGEMPYICQVCNFRSSFYGDVVIHFRELHKDTNSLQCSYCLKVFKSSNGYQLHYSKHQKKTVQHCDKCRLQFLYSKEKADHKALCHRTHLKPVQLMGLKPGTRVTIRAYSVTKIVDGSTLKAHNTSTQSPPLKISPSPSASVAVPPAKRKPVESMLELMTKFQSQCEPAKKQFCMECNYEIPDFSVHFPTFVCCSLCHYCTCCSRAYANHMISNHIPRKTQTKYLNLYKPCPKLGQLSCSLCNYTTKVGDSMAKHLVDNPDHCSSHCKFSGGFSRGYKRFVFIPTDLIRQRLDSRTLLPFRVVQVGHRSFSDPSKPGAHPNQCINLPVSTAHMPSIPIQVQPVDQSTVPDENCGTRPRDSSLPISELSDGAHSQQGHAVGGSLTLTQLKMLLYALCFGVPQAANHFDTQPEEVQSLLLKRQHQLGPPQSREGLVPRSSDRLAEWVLCQREQQLPMNEGKLFSKASEIMSKDGGPGISYEWAVDFLLRHNLGVHALSMCSRMLPPKSQEHVHSFTRIITKQISSQGFAQSTIGAMDEFSIFVDMEQLDPASADSSSMVSAFQLVGETDLLMDMVFTGLADGTMLPTMVFLKGSPLSQNAPSLPDFIIIEAKPEGFSDEERLQLWFDRVWRQHVDPGSGGKGLLVMDSYRGHMSDDFLAILNSANTLPAIVPRSCSCCLQPLEACVRPVLQKFLQARWSQHVMESPQDLIGAEPADLALLLTSWLTEMLNVLAAKPQFLQRSFDQVLSCSAGMAPEEVSKLVRSLSEALTVRAIKEHEAEKDVESAEKCNTSDITVPSPLPSPSADSQALKKIFEKDSDLESFLGFEDSEMIDC